MWSGENVGVFLSGAESLGLSAGGGRAGILVGKQDWLRKVLGCEFVVFVKFLSSLLVTRFGGSSVGAVFNHENVCAGTCAEDKDKGPNFEASGGIIGGSRSARNVGSNGLVSLEGRGQEARSSQD